MRENIFKMIWKAPHNQILQNNIKALVFRSCQKKVGLIPATLESRLEQVIFGCFLYFGHEKGLVHFAHQSPRYIVLQEGCYFYGRLPAFYLLIVSERKSMYFNSSTNETIISKSCHFFWKFVCSVCN